MKAQQIPLDAIRVLLSRAREKEGWQQLRDSMADPEIGLQVPVGVRELKKPEGKIRFELIYGEGRVEAARDLGWKTIPAIVKTATDAEVAGQFLAENMIRRPMAWAEKGRIVRDEVNDGASIEDVAKRLHISTRLAAKYHRVVAHSANDAKDEIMAMPINDAEVLATVPKEGQRIVIELAAEKGERVRDVAKAARQAMPAGDSWTKAGLVAALNTARDGKKKLEARLKVLRLHHALGPANIRTLLEKPAFRTAAKKEGVNLTKFQP